MSLPDLPPLVAELVAVLGRRKAFALCRAGGLVVYVPTRLNHRTRLVRMIGAADAAKLIERWAGQELQLPKLAAIDRATRDADIRRLAAEGLKLPQIAMKYGMSTRQARNILNAEKAPEEINFPKACNEGRRHSNKGEA